MFSGATRLRLVALLGLAAAPVLALAFPEVRDAVAELLEFIATAGLWGVVCYVALYVVSAVLVFPIWLTSGMAGYAFDAPVGFAVALPALILASVAAFGVGRRVVGRVELPARAARWQRALHGAVEREGAKIVTLLRLAPITPQNMLSYLLAGTPITLGRFTLASAIGLAPVTAVHVYLGSLVHDAVALVSGATPPTMIGWVVAALGLAAAVAAIVVVVRAARRSLAEAMRAD